MKRLILVNLLLLFSLIPSACRAGPIVSIALEIVAQISASTEAISKIPASVATSVVTVNALLASPPGAADQSFFGSAMSSAQVNVSGNSHAHAQGSVMWHVKLQVNQPDLDSILIQYTTNDTASVNSEAKAKAFGEGESSILIESGSLITKQARVNCASVAFTSCAKSDARESVAVFTIEDPALGSIIDLFGTVLSVASADSVSLSNASAEASANMLFTITAIAPIPEPATVIMCALALLGWFLLYGYRMWRAGSRRVCLRAPASISEITPLVL
jgi:hypothetical protein